MEKNARDFFGERFGDDFLEKMIFTLVFLTKKHDFMQKKGNFVLKKKL